MIRPNEMPKHRKQAATDAKQAFIWKWIGRATLAGMIGFALFVVYSIAKDVGVL